MLTTLAIENYRSLRDLILPLGRLTLITGANGSGKSSVYRALRLLAQVAQGRVIATLAQEGGFRSTLWAGPENHSRGMKEGWQPVQGTVRSEPYNLKLGFGSEQFGYLLRLGLPIPGYGAFGSDPHIKEEVIWAGPWLRRAGTLVERENALVRVKDGRGWQVLAHNLSPFDSMLTELADPAQAPEMFRLREQVRSWRFYDHFRTDADAPARQPQVGTYTPVLADDGRDLAAALQTIMQIGDASALAEAVDDAFPGCTIEIDCQGARFEVIMWQPGLLRPLRAAEFSDGTLRYLLWIAALLSPRPAQLLVLNEPETSLHPDLLPALGRLILQAAKQAQVIVVSHAGRLINTLSQQEDVHTWQLEKELGQTSVQGLADLERPAWHWSS
ncbi:AAA family ATPase [Silvimonas iriomotensis]|uniref:ATPase AAA-type core domain-containing protein n=1 Tax=Silvimonas iriomotensis TaxID=449662 RepID=A0ABQ2P4C9_9NEIS|nr:AAA family ATPase [Silvimonas iriomotensis]GGP18057.1 hypothetical protein GCM10010970_02920 [Silvimonas iriomotensis]